MTTRRLALVLGIVLVVGVGVSVYLRSPERPAPASVSDSVEARRRTPRTRPVRDPKAIPALLRDTSWSVRLSAANALRVLTAIDVPRRAALLAEALNHEASRPAIGPPLVGSYLPLTSAIRLQYLAVLEGFGPAATDAVRAAADPTSPAAREWRTLAVAATGAPDVAPDLRRLLGSSDPAVRMTAARYLGYLEDRGAEPELRKALADPFVAEATTDALGAAPTRVHPVREQAARALRALGHTVDRRGETFTVR